MSRAGLIMCLYGALALAALLISAGRGDVDIYRIESASNTTWLVLSPLIGLAAGMAFVFMSRMAVHSFEWARQLHRDFRGILGQLTAKEMFILAIASAVGEELLFRGALQPIVGIWLQALIFALLHLGPGARFLPWTLSAFVVGVAFGYLFSFTGDLGGPIVAHFTINFVNLHFISRVELPTFGDAARGRAADI